MFQIAKANIEASLLRKFNSELRIIKTARVCKSIVSEELNKPSGTAGSIQYLRDRRPAFKILSDRPNSPLVQSFIPPEFTFDFIHPTVLFPVIDHS